jgi:hypothetical protein
MRHTAELKFEMVLGNSTLPITAYITFDIKRGVPAQGPSYASGGQPAEPAEIDYQQVEIEVKGEKCFKRAPAPEWLASFIMGSDDVYWYCGDSSNWGEMTENPNEEYEKEYDESDRDLWARWL